MRSELTGINWNSIRGHVRWPSYFFLVLLVLLFASRADSAVSSRNYAWPLDFYDIEFFPSDDGDFLKIKGSFSLTKPDNLAFRLQTPSRVTTEEKIQLFNTQYSSTFDFGRSTTICETSIVRQGDRVFPSSVNIEGRPLSQDQLKSLHGNTELFVGWILGVENKAALDIKVPINIELFFSKGMYEVVRPLWMWPADRVNLFTSLILPVQARFRVRVARPLSFLGTYGDALFSVREVEYPFKELHKTPILIYRDSQEVIGHGELKTNQELVVRVGYSKGQSAPAWVFVILSAVVAYFMGRGILTDQITRNLLEFLSAYLVAFFAVEWEFGRPLIPTLGDGIVISAYLFGLRALRSQPFGFRRRTKANSPS